jgi:hypothetical protein
MAEIDDAVVREGGSLRAWADGRGLAYADERLLPPLTTRLRAGLGTGDKRSEVGVPRFGGRATSTSHHTRPERRSSEVCRGTLPGGLDGTLAHHVYLGSWTHTETGGRYRRANRLTVVLATLPHGSRVASGLQAGAPGSQRALAQVDLGRRHAHDPVRTIAPHPTTRVERGGLAWSFATEEDDATVEAIAGPAQLAAFAAAPEDTRAEVEHGALCVFAPGLLDDPDALDALCRLAAALADGIGAAVAQYRPLQSAESVGPPAPDARSAWVDAGVATVAWPAPPESVAAAAAAYAPVVAARAGRVGRLAGALLVLVAALVAAGLIGAALLWRDLVMLGGAAVTIALGAWRLPQTVRGTHREVSGDEVDARARPWGLEAFARGYAAARGLAREDVDGLRRRFDAPFPGFPQKAFHGDLGGVTGHLLVWIEPRPALPPRHLLVALVPPPERLVAAPAPYVAQRRGEVCAVTVEVTAEQRTTAALDALAAVACALTAPAGASRV